MHCRVIGRDGQLTTPQTKESRTMKTQETITCYGQTNSGSWCQEMYETTSRQAGKRAKQLRVKGYQVIVSALGMQVTKSGLIKLTMVDIRPGKNQDTFYLPAENWTMEWFAKEFKRCPPVLQN